MKIYIASSWRNQHAVEMLTCFLRLGKHEVVSFIEHRGKKERDYLSAEMDFDEWIWSAEGAEVFAHDIKGATEVDLMIYVGPSGTDAWAEVGAAWAKGIPVIGLWAKAEPAGLMRRMVEWWQNYKELLAAVDELAMEKEKNDSQAAKTS